MRCAIIPHLFPLNALFLLLDASGTSVRFLATGADFQTISFNFRLGHSTVHEIVHSTSKSIWENLSETVMPQPTPESLQNRAQDFRNIWNFPNCVGALDGKHITIQAPKRSGSLYFNYKKTFSIVLLALVDANYKFIAVDVGSYGKNSDGGIFTNSAMGKALCNKTFGMTEDAVVSAHSGALPYVIVGDEAFPLKTYLMRPYSGRNLPEDKRIFNYRLSRARRVSENAFGMICQKFRLFFGKMQLSPSNADSIILSALCLHNFLRNDNLYLSTLMFLEDFLQMHSQFETILKTTFVRPVVLLIGKPLELMKASNKKLG